MLQGTIWNAAVLESGADVFDLSSAALRHLLSAKQLRWRRGGVHTYADPFLFVYRDVLYLLVEVQRVGQPGYLAAYATEDLERWSDLGPILNPDDHVSYPQVLGVGDSIYLLPETEASGRATLYRFDDFPYGPKPVATLLQGAFTDPTVFRHRDGLWYLWASDARGLHLFWAEQLVGPYQTHPCGVLYGHPHQGRCAGGIVEFGDELLRPAQNADGGYGSNLNIMRIEELSPHNFRESIYRADLVDHSRSWSARGGHHFSLAQFRGRTLVATDGLQSDYRTNRAFGLIQKALPW